MKSHYTNLFDNITSRMGKGKEPIKDDEDDSRSSSNTRDNGRSNSTRVTSKHFSPLTDYQENFEYISRRGIVSARKRERIYDFSEKQFGSKRLRRLSNGDLSFMKWVTTITSGLTTPKHINGVRSPPSILHEKKEYFGVSHETKGFATIFQSMYHRVKYIEHHKKIDVEKKAEREEASGSLSFVKHSNSPHASNLAPSKWFNADAKNSPSSTIENCAVLMAQSRHVSPNSMWISRLSRGACSAQRLDALKDTKPLKQLSDEDTSSNKSHENRSLINHDGEILLWNKEGEKDHHLLFHGRNSSPKVINKAVQTDFVDQVEGTVNTDRMEMASFCGENEVKSSEFKPFCSVIPSTKGVFDAVRRLRLTRMDVIRWLKSRPRYNPGGFFVRLRIGNLEKGEGSTGYHVACIHGASCRSSISVCVENSTYLVTSRFISNHDFHEEELKAWWLQKLRDGTKLPSKEELNEKLQMRLKLGF